jgi:hypothetical protein
MLCCRDSRGDLGIASRASKVLKEFHALMYHVPSRTYRFYSPTFSHAARNLLRGGGGGGGPRSTFTLDRTDDRTPVLTIAN